MVYEEPKRRQARKAAQSKTSTHVRLDTPSQKLGAISQSILIRGNAYDALDVLPSRSVQTIVTSPPYWSLRDYGVEDQVGCEDSLESYIDSVVQVFGKARRVLKDDGTIWLNVGDVYTSGNRRYRAPDRKNKSRAMSVRPPTPDGLKPKDLIGIPWRLAFALQSDGWWLRSEVIWNKPNAHPESVRDRLTKSHETVFLLSKSQNYHYDIEAVRGPNGRRLRSVWDVPTEPQRQGDGHPAIMPMSLAHRCISITTKLDSVVLDPYAGSGTTLFTAQDMGLRWVGIDISPSFIDMIERRMSNVA